MGTTGRKWIEQWLRTVSPEGLEGDKVRDPGRRDAVMPNEDPQLLHAMLKPRNATLTPLQTQHTKRMRGQLDEIQSPLVNMHSKKPRGYDKQPRRRTRENRYKYQSTDMTGGRVHQGRKPSKVRRSRKATINDGFRASNVARNRLTLPSLAALGIFSKGKSSSPLQKHHDQYHHADNENVPTEMRGVASKTPSLACSVTILSGSEKIFTTNHAKSGQLETHRSHLHGQGCLGPSFEKDLMLRTDQLSWRPIKSIDPNHEDSATIMRSGGLREVSSHAMPFAGVNRLEECGQPMRFLRNQDTPSFGAMSVTPYAWFESNTCRLQFKRVLKDILLAEAHDKLCAVTDTQNDNVGSMRRHYELNDLQKLLASRKAMWGEDAGGNSEATCPSSSLTPRHAHTESISSKMQQIGVTKINQINAEGMDDKDLLFQQLDKLFQEIAEPDDGELNLEGKQLEILPAELQSLHEPRTDSDNQCLQHTYEAHSDRLHLISYDRSWLTDDTSASLCGTFPVIHAGSFLKKGANRNDKDLQIPTSTRISDDNILSRESCLTEDYNSHLFARTLATPHRSNAFPLGFWRKNKLY